MQAWRLILFIIRPFERWSARVDSLLTLSVYLGVSFVFPVWASEWLADRAWLPALVLGIVLIVWATVRLFRETYPKAFAWTELETSSRPNDGRVIVSLIARNLGPPRTFTARARWHQDGKVRPGNPFRTVGSSVTEQYLLKDDPGVFDVVVVFPDRDNPARRVGNIISGSQSKGGYLPGQYEITGMDGYAADLVVDLTRDDPTTDARYRTIIGFDNRGVPSINEQGMVKG